MPSLDQAGTKLVVVDFHATWCGPCKRIAPEFVKFSTQYSNVVFLKVDVDQCKLTAEKYDITAMPTFVFIKSKQKIDDLKGADASALLEKIKKYAGDSTVQSGDGGDDDVKGYGDLASFFNSNGCDCLNESNENTFSNVF